MTDGTTRDRAILGSLLDALSGKCLYCGCTGGECKTVIGEPCELMGEMQNRCNGVACEVRHFGEKRNWRRRAGKTMRVKAKGRA